MTRPTMTRPVTSRWRRRALIAGVATALVVTGAVAVTPLWLTGPRFGRLVEQRLPHTRGRVHVGGGSWSWGTVWALARGRAAPLLFDDVSLTDPDGVVVFHTRHLSTAIERTHAPEGLLIRELRVEDGMWRMAQTADRKGIGFLRALEEAPSSPGAGPGAKRSSGGLRSLRCEVAVLDGLDVDFDLPGWALALRQVHGRCALALEQNAHGPATFTFAVTDADVRAGGRIAVLDGSWRTTLPFSSARITRIAADPAAPDAIAVDASQIVTGRSTTALRGSFTGILPAPGPPRPAGLELTVTMQNAADAMQAVAAMRGWTPRLAVAGDGATLAMSFAGPFSAPRLDVRAAGFDVRFGELSARAFGFHLEAQPAMRQVRLQDLAFGSPTGGRLVVNAQLDGRRAAGTLTLQRFDTNPYLPPGLRQVGAGTVQGQVAGQVDLAAGTAALDRVALTIVRPPGTRRPTVVHLLTEAEPVPPRSPGDSVLRLGRARLDRGTLELPRLSAAVAGGRIAAAGSVNLWDPIRRDWLPSPSFDLSLDVSRLFVEQLLGVPLATGQLSLRARARGTFDALKLQARVPAAQRVRILGTTFVLPPALLLSLAAGTITLAPLTLSGAAGETLAAQGTVTTAGGLALQARATNIGLRALVAWAAGLHPQDVPVDGRVGVELALAGDVTAPATTGTLAITGAQFHGRALGGGVLALTTGPRGELRARGTVIDGLTLDGVVKPAAPGGARAAGTLTLARLQLAPFLATLAPLAARLHAATIAGEASGVIAASISAGGSPTIDARLSKLTVAARPSAPAAGEPLTLDAVGPVHVATQAATGAVRLEPARFSGSAGALELSGDWRAGSLIGRTRGRLNAAGFAPFVRDTIAALDGAVEVDVEVTAVRGGAPEAAGTMAIAAPVRARFVALPFDVVATAGRLRLGTGGATLDNLLLNVGGAGLRAGGRIVRQPHGPLRAVLDVRGAVDARLLEPLAQGYLRDAEGQAPVTGRLEGDLAHLALRGRLDVGGIAFTLMPGANRIRFASGDVTFDGRAAMLSLSLSNLDLRIGDGNQLVIGGDGRDLGRLRLSPGGALDVDLPVQGRVRALATPVAIIDTAAFGVRLTGAPGRSLRLAGDVFIDAAHVPPSLRSPKRPVPAASASGARAVLNATHLDLRVRSKPRAVTVEVAHVPDLHAALDYHLGGTVGAPEVKGSVKPAGVYSSIALFLARLLN